VLRTIENKLATGKQTDTGKAEKQDDMPAFVKALDKLDIDSITPLEALNFLQTLKNEMKEELDIH
jgi:hypothetical protein